MTALRASRRKITIFIVTVMTVVVVFGSLMYLVEGETNGFTSIPTSIYWAIVTLTTVGYGDISPQTGLGQLLAATIMLLGYAIIAVPTGIVTVELSRAERHRREPRESPQIGLDDGPLLYEVDAVVPPDLADRFETYMRQHHMPDLLNTGCFDEAVLARSETDAYRTSYRARDCSSLDRYLDRFAAGLRADFEEEFGGEIHVSRQTWTIITAFGPVKRETMLSPR